MYNDQQNFIFKKEVDWSVLHEGFSIPVAFQADLQAEIGGLPRGQDRIVFLHILGEVHKAKIKNQSFDEAKYIGHPDVLQVRYSKNSSLAQKLRIIFGHSFETLKVLRDARRGNNHFKVPTEAREYIAIYGGNKQGDFVCECIQNQDIAKVRSFFDEKHITEEEFESSGVISLRDSDARIETKEQIVRIRRLDRSIGNAVQRQAFFPLATIKIPFLPITEQGVAGCPPWGIDFGYL